MAVSLLLPIHVHDWFFIVFHAIGASLMLSLIGVLAGLWADKFDQMAAVTNFIIQPLSFLSGAFYSTQRLPDLWRAIAHLNPFFYMIDGFRYGFIGHADGSLLAGVIVIASADILLGLAAVAAPRHRLQAPAVTASAARLGRSGARSLPLGPAASGGSIGSARRPSTGARPGGCRRTISTACWGRRWPI